ncbi:MAG: 50S ribosomal protein L1 [Anaerolineales bacterium]|jgi:large subunit ribosomal protein L1|nr:MAG: 50S ribosomal protein L1 [Anaerolineales bacterium]
MPQHGRKYRDNLKLIDRQQAYSPEEAIELVQKTSFEKFDASVDLHLAMNLDPRKADQQIRGTVLLPSGSGKAVRIVVFAEGEAAKHAEEAGADHVGSDDLVKRVEEGWFEFDVAMAIPQMMGKVGRLGKILGPRGLMPNPKTGTVVQPEDLQRAVTEARQGRVEYRLDKTANIHLSIGKVSFSQQQLTDNLTAVLEAITRAKPSGAKGRYINKITLTSTMGPGIKVDINQALAVKVV